LRRTNAYKQSPWMRPIKLAYQAVEFGLGQFMLADNITVVCRKK
jgi:hypothetical protein